MCDDRDCIFKFIPSFTVTHIQAVASCLALFLEHPATRFAFLRQCVNLKIVKLLKYASRDTFILFYLAVS